MKCHLAAFKRTGERDERPKHWHSGQIIRGADEAARARGYNLLVFNTSGSAGPESKAADVESLLARRVDGILYASMHHRELHLPANLGSSPAVLACTLTARGSVAPPGPAATPRGNF